MSINAFPLEWPAGWIRAKTRKPSKFNKTRWVRWENGQAIHTRERTFADSRDGLLRELKLLGAQNIILSTNIPVKQDGLPYARYAEPKDPGVAVYFKYKGKGTALACDVWQKVMDNVWATALTIEAMRGISRWGASELMDRAFTGFQALPPPAKEDAWWVVLGVKENERNPDVLRAARDGKAKKHHPDVGGSHELMAKINHALDEALEVARCLK